jgi:dipeptidyl aminopeptidase/acylaminoacyl peptidase
MRAAARYLAVAAFVALSAAAALGLAVCAGPAAARAGGAEIACAYKNHIWVMDASGGDRRWVTEPTSENPAGQDKPAWSPDGRQLCYVDYAGVTNDTGARLWVVGADGTYPRRLDVLGDQESVTGVPAWSPDGRQIAFVNTMDLQVGDPEKSWQALFAYDVSTGVSTQLYRAPRGDLIEGLAWTADSRRVEFSSDNRWAVQMAEIHGRHVRLVSRLRSVALATRRVLALATAPRGAYFAGIARSPDGRSVAVSLSRQGGDRRSAILTGPMGGRPRHVVVRATQATTAYLSVSWSPDAKRLAYGIYTPNGYSTWVIGRDGKRDHKILAGGAWPAWSPQAPAGQSRHGSSDRMVRVPSWRRFRSSYTGTDWDTILKTGIAAIKAGFAKRGLIARVTLVNGYDGSTSRQRPKAGTWAPKGTVVRVRLAVYD